MLFVLYVFCKAYEGDGYFLKWDKDDCLIAAEDLKESPAYISEVLQGCLARSLFDEGVYQMFGVLTSAGIQRRYLRGCEKRDEIEIASEYWLLDVNDKKTFLPVLARSLPFEVSGEKRSKFPRKPSKIPRKPQSKVKESKEKKSKDIYKGCTCLRRRQPDDISFSPPERRQRISSERKPNTRMGKLYPLVDIRQELRNMCGWLQGNPRKGKQGQGS